MCVFVRLCVVLCCVVLCVCVTCAVCMRASLSLSLAFSLCLCMWEHTREVRIDVATLWRPWVITESRLVCTMARYESENMSQAENTTHEYRHRHTDAQSRAPVDILQLVHHVGERERVAATRCSSACVVHTTVCAVELRQRGVHGVKVLQQRREPLFLLGRHCKHAGTAVCRKLQGNLTGAYSPSNHLAFCAYALCVCFVCVCVCVCVCVWVGVCVCLACGWVCA